MSIPPGKIDQWLDPPDEAEHYLPLEAACFSALLRAVDEWLGKQAHGHDTWADRQRETLIAHMTGCLREVGCSEVYVTEAEWQAHCQAVRDRALDV